MPNESRTDVLVSGASHAGIAFALAVATAEGAGLEVVLVDPGSRAPGLDVRTFAISAASRNLLEAIGVWAGMEAEPVVEIEITDPKSGSALREPMLK